MDKIEQVVRLIRSKGVGVYFVTQNPLDVPEKVLAQLGNRVQHALARLHAARPESRSRQPPKHSAPIPSSSTEKVITELGKGEALVSFLEGNGTPAMVERVMIRPPSARMGPITAEQRKAILAASPVKGKYDTEIDSESAYEMLHKRVAKTAAPAEGESGGILGQIGALAGAVFGTARPRGERLTTGQLVARNVARTVTGVVVGGVAAKVGKSVAGSMGSSIGRSLVRGALGSLLRR